MSKMRPCTEHGCGVLHDRGGRCPKHRAIARRERGDRPHTYEDAKRFPAERAAAIGTPCPWCGEPMLDDQELVFGHSVDYAVDNDARPDRVEHKLCGERAGGQLSQQLYPLRGR